MLVSSPATPAAVPFAHEYAAHYDRLYADKPYDDECERLLAIWRDGPEGPAPGARLLDLGCGTGNHVIPMAQRGFAMTGLDRSPGMLRRAREKAQALAPERRPRFEEGDIRTARLGGEPFDAVVSLFDVFSYLTGDDDVRAGFATAAAHLRPGGMFFAEVWFGPGVLTDPPAERVRELDLPDGERLLRHARPTVNLVAQTVTVHYRMLRLRGDQVIEDGREAHTMRFFFPRELALLCAEAGLGEPRLHPTGDHARLPDARDWHVILASRKPA